MKSSLTLISGSYVSEKPNIAVRILMEHEIGPLLADAVRHHDQHEADEAIENRKASLRFKNQDTYVFI